MASLALAQSARELAIASTPAEVDARMKALALRNDLSPAERDRVLAIWHQASDAWKRHDASAAQAERFRQELKDTPARREKAKAELEKSLAAAEIKNTDSLSQAQWEAAFAKAQADLAAARVRVEAAEGALNQRKERIAKIPQETAKIRSDLAELKKKLAEGSATDESSQANAALLRGRDAEWEQTLLTLNDELSLAGANPELLSLERDLAVREAGRLSDLSDKWRELVEKRRQEQLKLAAQQATDEAAKNPKYDEITELAKRNQQLVDERKRLADPTNRASASEALMKRLAEQFKSASERVAVVERLGASIGDEIGRLLQRQRSSLPDPKELEGQISKTLQEAANLELKEMEWSEERQELSGDLERLTTDFLRRFQINAVGEETNVQMAVRQLLEARRRLLDQLVADSGAFQTALVKENQALQEALRIVRDFRLFIDERVLWIRSESPIQWSQFSSEIRRGGRLLTPSWWSQPLHDLGRDARENLMRWSLALLITTLLLTKRAEYLRCLSTVGQNAAKSTCTNFLLTLRALVCSVAAILPLPLLLFFLATRCHEIGTASVEPIGHGLWASGLGLLNLGFVRVLFHPAGLAAKHFDLSEKICDMVFEHTRWLNWSLAPVNFCFAALHHSGDQAASRWFFLLIMALLSVFAMIVFRPSRHLLILGGKSTTLAPFATPLYLAAIGIPLVSLVAAGFGYLYSVTELFWRLHASFRGILLILLLTFLFLRWLLLARRKLAIEQARKRRRAAVEVENRTGETGLTQAEVEAELVDISRVKQQSDRLVKSAAWLAVFLSIFGLWKDVLPALTILDKVRLWGGEGSLVESAAAVGSSLPSDALLPKPSSPAVASASTVTLKDFLLFVFTLFVTWIAAHNIPGILECSILRRLNLQAGGSYAITTTVRYVMVLVGVILAFGFIQISWSKVQWLAAAITVGIGFGLQEIFANFVAGLILLFERPIRVGDWVTVDEISGRVTQIRMRATTIIDLMHKELVVPNKVFITGKLINWTLSDPIIRTDIRVGVAYGSDTSLVRETLIRTAREHPLVLRNPEPQAIFKGFGASSLDFELRVFVKDADNLTPVQSDLHFAVDKVFREKDIEIAFPRSDIRIKSVSAEPGSLPMIP